MSTTTSRRVLARSIKSTINTGTTAAPVRTEILGLDTVNFQFSKTDADASTFDNEGWAEHLPAMRSLSVTLSGKQDLDPVTKDATPGQAAVEALANEVDYDGFAEFQFTFVSGRTLTFTGSVSVNPGGGGVNDPSKWEATVTANGKPVWAAPTNG